MPGGMTAMGAQPTQTEQLGGKPQAQQPYQSPFMKLAVKQPAVPKGGKGRGGKGPASNVKTMGRAVR